MDLKVEIEYHDIPATQFLFDKIYLKELGFSYSAVHTLHSICFRTKLPNNMPQRVYSI